MKWSDPILVNLSANAQGDTPCNAGSGYVAPGCDTGSTYGQGCDTGAAYGIAGNCQSLGISPDGMCLNGTDPN